MSDTPNVVARAGNFAVALVRHVAAGLPQAPPDVKAGRLDLCRACEHLTAAGVCDRCGCVMAVKAGWAESRCPAGKW